MVNQMTTMGERIKQLRLQKNLSQEGLAEIARAYVPQGKGLQRESISRVENDHTRADSWTVLALAKALNTSTEYLFGNTDDPRISAEPDYPVPKPDMWRFVRRMNDMPNAKRRSTIGLIEHLLDYIDAYTLADAAVADHD